MFKYFKKLFAPKVKIPKAEYDRLKKLEAAEQKRKADKQHKNLLKKLNKKEKQL